MNTTERRLLHGLARELYQVEVSAAMHAGREAVRFEGSAPGTAMLDVSRHADRVLDAIGKMFETRDIRVNGLVGAAAGMAFSLVRKAGLDFIMGPERSYRFTLLGLRHGIDLVYELKLLADQLGDDQLAGFCRTWLEQRVPAVTAVERQLVWFVTHTDRALVAG
ncbi:MAG: hypothetical protein JNK82_01875 [Myxococcaceae bacterium]|nr:hypothetical protein [Myxococcaceae bacterium]